MIEWIAKGRVIVSADGRWRVAHVLRGWVLYDRQVLLCTGFPTAEAAKQKAENDVAFQGRRRTESRRTA